MLKEKPYFSLLSQAYCSLGSKYSNKERILFFPFFHLEFTSSLPAKLEHGQSYYRIKKVAVGIANTVGETLDHFRFLFFYLALSK